MNFIKTVLAVLFVGMLVAGCTPAVSPTPVTPVKPESKPAVAPVEPSGPLEFTNAAQKITVKYK